MKNRLLLALSVSVIILSMLACSFGQATQTPTATEPVGNPPVNSPVNPPQSSLLEIASTSSFTDEYNGFYVFGEVVNNSGSPVTTIELSITITDASGASILKDDNGNPTASDTFYTMLWTLDTDESTPFSYYFDTTNGIPADFTVSVTDFEESTASRGNLQSENVQIVEDGSGYYILTGELVNLGDQWVHVWGLTGGVLDDANTVLSADWTGTYTSLLAPASDTSSRNRTPFYVTFPVPTSSATQWSLWWDAEIETDIIDFDLTVEVTNSYFDEYGSAHLVGIVGNNTDKILTTLVVAGLYAEDGTTLDASYSYVPLPIPPGRKVPFDISYFGSVNWLPEQAALVSTFSAQIDPWNTYESTSTDAPLTPTNENVQKDTSSWTVTGGFTNSTPKNLSDVTAVVSVYDAANNLVATGYTVAYPTGDSFAPGETGTYEIYVYFAPGVDTSGFTIQTFLVAEISQ